MKDIFFKAMGINHSNKLNNKYNDDTFYKQFMSDKYIGRKYVKVEFEQELLWNKDKLMALRFPFYLRMITRKIKVNEKYETKSVQYGRGLKDESFKRLLSIAEHHSYYFYKNIWLLPIVGSWKDIWELMIYDYTLGLNVIDKNVLFLLIKTGMKQKFHSDLIKKYMPRIVSKSKLKTNKSYIKNNLAKEFCNFLGWSYKKYNKYKSSGNAINFQRQICLKDINNIKWEKVPQKSLMYIFNSSLMDKYDLSFVYDRWKQLKDSFRNNKNTNRNISIEEIMHNALNQEILLNIKII